LNAPAKGRDTARAADLRKIQNFLVTEDLAGQPTGIATSTCIVETSPAVGSTGEIINDNISEFAGVFPKDPQSTHSNIFGSGTDCGDEYIYIHEPGDYGFALATTVEIEDNGNILCSQITATAVDPANIVRPGELDATNDDPCFVILYQ